MRETHKTNYLKEKVSGKIQAAKIKWIWKRVIIPEKDVGRTCHMIRRKVVSSKF